MLFNKNQHKVIRHLKNKKKKKKKPVLKKKKFLQNFFSGPG